MKSFKEQIKNIIPDYFLDLRIKLIQKIKLKNALSDGFLNFADHFEERQEMTKRGSILDFPYGDILNKYNYKSIVVKHEDIYPYVIHTLYGGETAKLFFPSSLSDRLIKFLYNSLMIEQDVLSPHCYFDEKHKLEPTDVLYDIGAAEGIVALTYINVFKKAYIFEGDEKWIVPLKKTFAPFANKVEIIDKCVSDIDSDTCVKLEHYIDSSAGTPFIKLDVEGMEMQILNNIRGIFKNNKCKASICVYHNPNDAIDISNYFIELGYKQRFTPRYMFLDYNDDHYSFRKCVLYVDPER